jgi:hypothetical protein
MSMKKMDGSTQTLVGAYGRDYSSPTKMQEDFVSGKDFIMYDPTSRWNGKYCSIRDFEPGVKVRARYLLNREITFLEVPNA